MRSIRIIMLAATLASTAAPAAFADDKQEIRDLYAKLRLAILGTLPQGFKPILAEGFTATDMAGKPADVNQLIRQMKLPEQDVSRAKMYLMIYKFNITPPTAQVPYKYYYSAIIIDRAGQLGAKGKQHDISTSGLILCDAIKTPAGWMLKSMKLKEAVIRVDRKSVGGARRAP